MANSYLELAEEVIKARGKPLSARSILAEAKRFGLMPDHLTGSTMHKTLQARISDDINSHHEFSKFYRVGVGTYFLRELSADPTLPGEVRREKPSPGRVKSIEKNRVLHSKNSIQYKDALIADVSEVLSWIESHNCFRYASTRLPDEFLIGTFTVIRWGNDIFLHELGKFSFFFRQACSDQSTIGLRRYIDEFDDDIFKVVDFGIDFSSAREVIRNLAICNEEDFIDDRKIRNEMSLLGAAFESDINSLFFVVQVNLSQPRDQTVLFKKRKDIRNPHWVGLDTVERTKLDPLSRLVISSGIIS